MAYSLQAGNDTIVHHIEEQATQNMNKVHSDQFGEG